MIPVTCGQCGQVLQVPEEYIGQRGKCKHCGGGIVVTVTPVPTVEEARKVLEKNAPVSTRLDDLNEDIRGQRKFGTPYTSMMARMEERAALDEAKRNWFDRQAQAYDNSPALIWLHCLICQIPGVIVGLLFLFGCGTDDGRDVGRRLLTYSGWGLLISFVLGFIVGILAGAGS